jgi:hypothetical protein
MRCFFRLMGSHILRRSVQGAVQKWTGQTQTTLLGPSSPKPSSLFISVLLGPLWVPGVLCV